MSNFALSNQISYLIDQSIRESEDILKEYKLDAETFDCLSRLISKNHETLNSIRVSVFDYLEK